MMSYGTFFNSKVDAYSLYSPKHVIYIPAALRMLASSSLRSRCVYPAALLVTGAGWGFTEGTSGGTSSDKTAAAGRSGGTGGWSFLPPGLVGLKHTMFV